MSDFFNFSEGEILILLSVISHLISAIRSFGGKFEPRTSSAQDLSTSELLRTL